MRVTLNLALRRIAARLRRGGSLVPRGHTPDQGHLIARLDAFNSNQLDELARALWALWAALNEQFGGLDGFLKAEAAERLAYLHQLAEVADRTAAHRFTAKGHYHYAVVLMLRYARAWVEPGSEATEPLLDRIVQLVERGRMLAAAPPVEHPARSVLGGGFSSGPVTLEMIDAGEIEPACRESALIAYFDVAGLRAGDTQRITVIAPGGEVLSQRGHSALSHDLSRWVVYSGKEKARVGWPGGVYEAIYTVTHRGSIVLEHRARTELVARTESGEPHIGAG